MTEKSVSYKEQVELFNSKVQEFRNIISDEPIGTRLAHPEITHILDTLNLNEDTSYFSVSYFYEGLKNTLEIKKGNEQSIGLLWFVIACVLRENGLKSPRINDYKRMKDVSLSSYSCKIKIVGGEKNITLQLMPTEKEFVSDVLPYLINQDRIDLLTKKINNPESTFQKMSEELDKQEKQIEGKLQVHQKKADDLADFIKKQQSNLNFVGLGKAFKQITKEKNTVKNNLEHYLTGFFIALILIPFCVGISIWCCGDPNYYICIPATTIELLLLYAFRLFYQQYMFVKSELLQVNLRHNLCAFIESYMEFKKDNKDNTVDLFEQLIFSNIISDEKKVPATVDGLESIANIIQAIKNK